MLTDLHYFRPPEYVKAVFVWCLSLCMNVRALRYRLNGWTDFNHVWCLIRRFGLSILSRCPVYCEYSSSKNSVPSNGPKCTKQWYYRKNPCDFDYISNTLWRTSPQVKLCMQCLHETNGADNSCSKTKWGFCLNQVNRSAEFRRRSVFSNQQWLSMQQSISFPR
jgi:hypothetical protein